MDSEQNNPSAEAEPKMQAHYDFSGGQRGRYARLFPQKPGVVILSPDMAAIFPDSDSVNEALRTLVKAVRGESSPPPTTGALMSSEDKTLPPVPPELQAEFDDWEAISDETMRNFAAAGEAGWRGNNGAFASVHFLSTVEGGRSRPLLSGYPGQFYDGETDWDAIYTFAAQPVLPGQTVNAYIEFHRPEAQRGRLYVGMVLRAREGNRTVGEGTLTWVSASFEE